MTWLFSRVLNMSLTGSLVIGFVLLARLALKKAPKIWSYALWAVVLFRLLCPVSLPSPVSLLEMVNPQTTVSEGVVNSVIYVPVEYVPVEIAPQESEPETIESIAPVPQLSLEAQPSQKELTLTLVSILWIAGCIVMLLYALASFLALRRTLVGAMLWKGNIYLADHIRTAFALGVVRPKIYLPSDTPKAERRYIVAHERHHIRRGDHVIKLLAYAALCIHWFNPLVWAAFILAGKDMEMSCDEAVIKKLGSHIRADYSQSLLRLATHRTVIVGTPLSFGEGDTRGRVLNMARWKKPKIWVSALCLLVCIVVIAACAMNPIGDTQTSSDAQEMAKHLPVNVEIDQLPKDLTYKQDSMESIQFLDGDRVVGGIVCYEIPDGVYDAADSHFMWLENVGIPDFEDPGLIYTGGITAGGGGWAAEFMDAEEDPAIYRRHHYYVRGSALYDIWYDRIQLDHTTTSEIRDCVHLPELSTELMEGPADCSLERFHFTLPEGMSTQTQQIEHNGNAWDYGYAFYADGKEVGGLALRYQPDGTEQMEPVHVSELGPFGEYWQKTIGVPEASMPGYAYTGGSSLYGDYETTYSPDIPLDYDENGQLADNPKTTYALENEVTHYFFVDGEDVYDLWLYIHRLPDITREKLLKSCYIEGQADLEAMAEAALTEEEALAKCRSVIESVQRLSSHITYTYSARTGTPESHEVEYLQNSEDWLAITTVPIGDTTERHASMFANGSYYTNRGHWAEETLIWEETDMDAQPRKPWLTVFDWREDVIAYQDTMVREEETSVMLRIDERYPYSDDSYTDNYFVNFIFDNYGRFKEAYLQVNVFLDNGFTQIESIRSLDSASVAAIIDTEYFSASGDHLAVPPPELNSEDTALARCESVLELVQLSSQAIRCDRENEHETGILLEYWKDGEDWMTIQSNVNGVHAAFLYKNGTYFDNREQMMRSNGQVQGEDIQWEEADYVTSFHIPWLSQYKWNDEAVVYLGTENKDGQIQIKLRIDDYFPGYGWGNDSYSVTMVFDENHSFLRAELLVNEGHFSGSEFAETETIVSLNSQTVAEQIEDHTKTLMIGSE